MMDLVSKKMEVRELAGLLKEAFVESLNEGMNRTFDDISDDLRERGFVWKTRIEISFEPELVNERVEEGQLDEKQAEDYIRAFEKFVP